MKPTTKQVRQQMMLEYSAFERGRAMALPRIPRSPWQRVEPPLDPIWIGISDGKSIEEQLKGYGPLLRKWNMACVRMHRRHLREIRAAKSSLPYSIHRRNLTGIPREERK